MTLEQLHEEMRSGRYGVYPERLTVTGAIRPGQWLFINVFDAGLTLYVADEDAALARTLWSDLPEFIINNVTRVSDPAPCVN